MLQISFGPVVAANRDKEGDLGRTNGNLGRVRSGDWDCVCGQRYRVLFANGEVRMWPANGVDGYRVEPIETNCVCGAPVSRGTVLSGLFGANVRVRVGPLSTPDIPPSAA
jgi:hypothetical protein